MFLSQQLYDSNTRGKRTKKHTVLPHIKKNLGIKISKQEQFTSSLHYIMDILFSESYKIDPS